MNKQEVIELLRDVAKRACYRTGRRSVHIDEIVELVNQIDEPQKVVVPKFVAEWIEKEKKKKQKRIILIYQTTGRRLHRNYSKGLDLRLHSRKRETVYGRNTKP